MALLEGGRLGAEREGVLRTVLAVGLWTQVRKHRANLRDSPLCVHCDENVVEDHVHTWWQCRAWAGIRAEHPRAVAAFDDGMPVCFARCGSRLKVGSQQRKSHRRKLYQKWWTSQTTSQIRSST